MPKDEFYAKLDALVSAAKQIRRDGTFGPVDPEEATKDKLIDPLLESLGYTAQRRDKEFHITGEYQVDYLLKRDRPLLLLEAKSLLDKADDLFKKHQAQVTQYIRNYRFDPYAAKWERPVYWIVLTNFAQFHFIRVNEEVPTFSFRLDELIPRRDELWDLLALENVEHDRIDDIYAERQHADLDKRFLADLKRWRLIIANGFALRNQGRPLADLTKASQQLLDRFIFCRMLETNHLIDHNKLIRQFVGYEEFFGAESEKSFSGFLRESLFREIKRNFNTELFQQPLLCDELLIDNIALATVIGHQPLTPDVAALAGLEQGPGEMLPFKHLYGYDFSKMSTDIMGAVYERFLAHQLTEKAGRIVIEDTDDLRKKEGIYYTPRYIVDYIVEQTVGAKIKPVLQQAIALLDYKNYTGAQAKILELAQIKVLDPAMGSGSFLLRAFDAFVQAYAAYNAECEHARQANGVQENLLFENAGKPLPVDRLGTRVAAANIFGVDLDDQAVEVAKLNLWIRLMTAERESIQKQLTDPARRNQALNLLPTLANNLKRGNSLIDDPQVAGNTAFNWQQQFPAIMQRGGFDCVIGNPPYGAYLGDGAKPYLTSKYECQSYQLDSYLLFLERGIKDLVTNDCYLGMIIPNPWLTNVLQQNTRRFITSKTRILRIAHFQFPVFHGVTVDTEIVLLQKSSPENWKTIVTIAKTQAAFESGEPSSELIEIEHQQDAWRALDGGVMNIFLTKSDSSLAGKILKAGVPAESLFEINVGIKPYQVGKGTPPQTRQIVDARTFDSDKKQTKQHRAYLIGSDIDRYRIAPLEERFIKYGPWLAEPRPAADFNAKLKILMRQTGDSLIAALDENQFLCLNNLHVLVPKKSKLNPKYVLGILNSNLLNWYYHSLNPEVGEALAEVKRTNVAALPIFSPSLSDRNERQSHDEIVRLVDKMLSRDSRRLMSIFGKQIAHSHRTPCSLAHYLQKDFAGAVKETKLIDDVQRKGFVTGIAVATEKNQITITAEVAATKQAAPVTMPVLRLAFTNEPLQQFIYAALQSFLAVNARKKAWTPGNTPQSVYDLIVNSLEPLVFFLPDAAENLRAIRELMKAVAKEAGTADLAAVEAEIAETDAAINTLVYELYGLTAEEQQLVERSLRS